MKGRGWVVTYASGVTLASQSTLQSYLHFLWYNTSSTWTWNPTVHSLHPPSSPNIPPAPSSTTNSTSDRDACSTSDRITTPKSTTEYSGHWSPTELDFLFYLFRNTNRLSMGFLNGMKWAHTKGFIIITINIRCNDSAHLHKHIIQTCRYRPTPNQDKPLILHMT